MNSASRGCNGIDWIRAEKGRGGELTFVVNDVRLVRDRPRQPEVPSSPGRKNFSVLSPLRLLRLSFYLQETEKLKKKKKKWNESNPFVEMWGKKGIGNARYKY